jgi:hypothetical protein
MQTKKRFRKIVSVTLNPDIVEAMNVYTEYLNLSRSDLVDMTISRYFADPINHVDLIKAAKAYKKKHNRMPSFAMFLKELENENN